jgi:hypothetical protein
MSFTMDMSSNQLAVDHDTNAGREDGIIFFGRAIEIIDIDVAHQHQLNLPLSYASEALRNVT